MSTLNSVSAIQLAEKPAPYNSPFLSVPDDTFVEMLMKSWITYWKLASGMQAVNVLPAYPDDTEKMVTPSLVMTRVGKDKFTLGRVDGYYGVLSGQSSNTLSELRGYRYEGVYQFDLYARTIQEQAKYESLMMVALRRKAVSAFDAIGVSEIPVYDFSIVSSGVLTNVLMKFRLFEDVDTVRVPVPFDKQLHQTSVRVQFWCDALKELPVSRIQKITVSEGLTG